MNSKLLLSKYAEFLRQLYLTNSRKSSFYFTIYSFLLSIGSERRSGAGEVAGEYTVWWSVPPE
jgi:hypothetical protein